MTDDQKNSLKASIQCYLERVGFPAKRGRLPCPFHGGDSKTTVMVDTRKGCIGGQSSLLYCPKCEKTWDVFSLHADLNGLDVKRDFVRICREVGEIVGIDVTDDAPASAPKFKTRSVPGVVPDDDAAKAIKEAIRKAKEYVERCANIEAPDAVEYLKSRDLSLETARRFGLRYDDGKVAHDVYDKDKWGRRIVIPTGEGFTARSIDPDCPHGYRHMKAPNAPQFGFGVDFLESGGVAWVVEGEFDALSLFEAGQVAVCLGGKEISALCRHLESRADFLTNPPRLLLALDDDDSGRTARDKLSKWLSEKGLSFAVAPPWHELAGTDATDEGGAFLVKDANGCLQNLGLDVFSDVVRNCVQGFKDKKEIDAENYAATNLSTRLATFWKEAQESDSAIQTGFQKLDAFLGGGLRPGLYVFGAIPSLGKTALILQMANTIADAGVDVLYFSLEMPAQDLAFRSISRLTFLKDRANALTQRELQFSKWDAFADKKAENANACLCEYVGGSSKRIWIYDSIGAFGVAEIEAAIAKHKALRGRAPVVVVDYLQILQAPDVRMTDKAALDANALRLKQISNTYAVPMLIVSSFNRANYASEVSFESFKESGAGEYCADCLFGLQFKAAIDAKLKHIADAAERRTDAIRQAIKDAKAKDVREIELVILKNRTGNVTGERGIYLNFVPRFNAFEEISEF